MTKKLISLIDVKGKTEDQVAKEVFASIKGDEVADETIDASEWMAGVEEGERIIAEQKKSQ